MPPTPDVVPPPPRHEGRIPDLVLVVAAGENGVIGRDGTLPWRMSSDLKLFRRLTLGKPILMGRRTWQALPKRPLDGRTNIVVSRDPAFEAPGALVATSIEAGLALARDAAVRTGASEIAVIGGAEIYRVCLPHTDRIYLTVVHAEPEGDATFPPLSASLWRVVGREPLPRTDKDDHAATLTTLERRQVA
ncbi:MAG: dihydrofolate reductase [Hyphomicrobiaceae bacterium]|nr:dihydrofolate reductase [Hyphomicrobiaceae bacterium]